MEIDLYWVVLFFFFVVLPIIQRVLGVGTKPGPPPPRRPQRRMPEPRDAPNAPRRLPETSRRETPPASPEPARRTDDEMDRAAEMIPAELWEILTGQRRPPVLVPPPSPEPDLDEELEPDEEVTFRPAPTSEDREAEELMRQRQREMERDRAVDRTPPGIITLETEPLPEPARHAAFHAQLAQPRHVPPAVLRRPPHAITHALRTRDALRRSIVLQEILGKPKGLE